MAPCNDGSLAYCPSRIDRGPWASCYYLCIERQTNEIVLANRGNVWVEDALTDVDSHMHLPDGDRGVRAAQKLCDLHMETGRKTVVFGHSLGCGAAVLFFVMLLGEEVRLLTGLKAYQTFRCSSLASPPCSGPSVRMLRWVRCTSFSSIHRVDVVPRCSVDNIVKTVFAFQQVDMETLPTQRLTNSSADQRLEQHLPYHVDLMHELDEHFKALRIISTLLLLSVEDGAMTACQVEAEQLVRVLLHPEFGPCHLVFQCNQCLYEITQIPPPDSFATEAVGLLSNRFRRDSGSTSERVDTESVEAASLPHHV